MNREEETGGPLGHGFVTLSSIIDLFLGNGSLLLLLLDLSGEDTGLHENLDGFFISQDVFDFREDLKHLCLGRRELASDVGLLPNEVRFLLLKLGLFLSDKDSEQLIGESLISDHKVENGDLGGDFGQVMRVTQLRAQEELEFVIVLECRITDLYVL